MLPMMPRPMMPMRWVCCCIVVVVGMKTPKISDFFIA
jgi:hypothetical protein